MAERKKGKFEIVESSELGLVVLSVPGQDEKFGLSPDDAASIGLSLANKALIVAQNTGIPIALDVVQPLFSRLLVGLPANSDIDVGDMDDLATVVACKDRIRVQLGDGKVFVISPDNARRLAESLMGTADHADGWVGTSKAPGGWSGTTKGEA